MLEACSPPAFPCCAEARGEPESDRCPDTIQRDGRDEPVVPFRRIEAPCPTLQTVAVPTGA